MFTVKIKCATLAEVMASAKGVEALTEINRRIEAADKRAKAAHNSDGTESADLDTQFQLAMARAIIGELVQLKAFLTT